MHTLNYRNYTPGVFFEWFKIGSAIQVSRNRKRKVLREDILGIPIFSKNLILSERGG